MEDFILTLYNDEIVFLSGGKKKYGEETSEVSAFVLKQSSWEPAPSLNEERRLHASYALKGRLYVCGGEGVNSIETHQVGVEDSWSILFRGEIVNRDRSAVALITENSFAVCGGQGNQANRPYGYLRDGYVFNVSTNAVTKILGSELDLRFDVNTNAQKASR